MYPGHRFALMSRVRGLWPGRRIASVLASTIVVVLLAGMLTPALVGLVHGTSVSPQVGPATPPADRPWGPASGGSAVDYVTAASVARAAYPDLWGGGWSIWFAMAFVNTNATFQTPPTTHGSCNVTWINPSSPPSKLYFPPTSPSATPGTSAMWAVELLQSSTSVPALLVLVANGTATAALTVPYVCINFPSNQMIPGGVVNSTTAVSAANAAGGSTFLAHFPNANKTYELLSNSSMSPANLWGVIYTSSVCVGNEEGQFIALMNSLNGSVVQTANDTYGCSYPVVFSERGLANGTNWGVSIAGRGMYGQPAPGSIYLNLTNGTYSYTVNPENGYRATPSSGNFTVSGASMAIPVTFTPLPGYYAVTFNETGLPPLACWGASINGSFVQPVQVPGGCGTYATILEPNGSYTYSVGSGSGGYVSVPMSGSVNVSGHAVTVWVTFVPGFPVTFTETGLLPGTGWWVAIKGQTLPGASSPGSIYTNLTNGSYSFTVNSVNGYRVTPSSGNFTVNGTSVTIPVSFARFPGYFLLTFNETGLPPSACWGASINGSFVQPVQVPGGCGTYGTILEPNGSYSYSVGSGFGGYVPVPMSGHVNVSGKPVNVSITFVRGYPVTFLESGLLNGTSWSVTVSGGSFYGTMAPGSIYLNLSNGTYSYTVNPVNGYRATPSSGNLTVNGTSVEIPVKFTPQSGYYPVRLNETGLPPLACWMAWVNGEFVQPTQLPGGCGTSATVLEPNGSYSFSVFSGLSGYAPVPSSGTVNVTGAGVSVAITFVPVFGITFTEAGLPNGTFWGVTITGGPSPGTTAPGSVQATLSDGNYSFTVDPVTGYRASPSSGNFTVNGASSMIPVAFIPAPGYYSVTFTESGLPKGTEWSVNVTGVGLFASTSSTIVFDEPNGTYPYTLATVNETYAAPGSSFTVNGAAVPEPVTFSLVTYTVTFTESGLPSGTEWWVNVTGQSALSSTGTTISTSLPNGSYTYTVASANKEYSASGGSFTVNGAAVPEPVTFSLVTYTVTFTESGLPSGTEWWVNVTGQSALSSTGTTISTSLPNGSYVYTVATVDKQYSSSGGSFTVNGAAVPEPVTFSLVTYTVTFTESGLPSGTEWWVNGTVVGSHSSTTTTISFSEPNGSYTYTVASANKEYAAAGGSVVVSGAAAPKSVTFSLVTYTVTFTETGLSSGTNWSVVLEGVSHDATGTTITFTEPNGSYSFTVLNVSGYTVKPSSGNLLVNGAALAQPIAFTTPSKAATFLGLPAAEGYALLAGIVVVVMVAGVAAGLLAQRRPKSPPAPPENPASPSSPPGST